MFIAVFTIGVMSLMLGWSFYDSWYLSKIHELEELATDLNVNGNSFYVKTSLRPVQKLLLRQWYLTTLNKNAKQQIVQMFEDDVHSITYFQAIPVVKWELEQREIRRRVIVNPRITY